MAAAEEAGVTVDYDQARERVYGMPYDQWKEKFQTPATTAARVQYVPAAGDAGFIGAAACAELRKSLKSIIILA